MNLGNMEEYSGKQGAYVSGQKVPQCVTSPELERRLSSVSMLQMHG